MLALKIHDVWAEHFDDVERCADNSSILGRRESQSTREFEGGLHFDGFDRSDSSGAFEVGKRGARQPGETTVHGEGTRCQVEGALAVRARGASSPDNRDQLGDAQCLWPVRCKSLARSLRRRHVTNRDVRRAVVGIGLRLRIWGRGVWVYVTDGASPGTQGRIFAVVHGRTVSAPRRIRT